VPYLLRIGVGYGIISSSVGWVVLGKHGPTAEILLPHLEVPMSNESLDEARRLLGQPRFTVRPLRDDLVELHGWPTASDATLAFLTPILGPSATLILHRLGGYASEGDSVWTPHEFAATFGLGHDEHTALAARSLARLVSFSMARIDSTGIAVRTHVGPLPERWAARLPAYLLDAYRSPTAA